MNERDFCFFLQGFLEIGNPQAISSDKVQIIRDHIDLVYKDEDSERNIENAAKNFHRWLDGFLTCFDKKYITKEQIILINNKLDKVFNKITPIYNSNPHQIQNTEYCSKTEDGYDLILKDKNIDSLLELKCNNNPITGIKDANPC